jgi:sec-independent protein translocase protein TatC
MASTLRPIAHDDRLSLVEHLDELRTRLIICLAAFIVALGVCLWQSDAILRIVNHPLQAATAHRTGDPLQEATDYQRQVGHALGLIAPVLKDAAANAKTPAERAQAERAAAAAVDAARSVPKVTARRPVTLGVGEPFTATFRVAASAAVLLVLPILLYEAYAFVLPAFSPRERELALPVMLLVPFLFIAGVAFAYFLALPKAISFLQNFKSDQFDILIQARDLYSFSIMVMGVMGLLFQVPIGIVALTRVGILTTAQLRSNRRYAFLIIAVIAMLLPGQDPVTMLVLMLPLLVLYEGSILVSSLLDRRAARAERRATSGAMPAGPLDTED